jgi:hypothetical protein
MQSECPRCHAILEFAGRPPSFCAYCGNALAGLPAGSGGSTADHASEAVTQAPAASAGDSGAAPEAVGGYRLLRPLGEGGMGTVYEAEDATSGRRVALKLITPDFATPEAVERFRQEGRLASMVVHPRCVFVLAADEEGGRPYLVLELMPGQTLEDLVREKGPLPLAEAVARVLDVLDGLAEVHRRGLIHRDVKPSNCFLDGQGGVKVGDFGLSKALAGEARLTKTGAFLGTPLYASPEQVRAERLDGRTDVYSAAATLYFCLTGRAPHETGDAAATLARIASDPAPSLRRFRPDVPAALDAVVLRGLERDRKRRWQGVDEFRAALAPFVPGQLAPAGRAVRAAAYLVDVVLVNVPPMLASAFSAAAIAAHTTPKLAPAWQVLLQEFCSGLLWLVCFLLLEGLWGCSPGKWALRLRVCTPDSPEPPGLGRALLRCLVFFLLADLGWELMMVGGCVLAFHFENGADPWFSLYPYLPYLAFLWFGAGLLVLASSMRTRNGYRGLHDLASGTRVVQLPWASRRRAGRGPFGEPETVPRGGLPPRIGPFVVKGAIRGTAAESVLLAEEPVLQRKVWLWLRPREAPPLPESRREIGRPTRLRWLGGGQEGAWRWDAFLAPPAGCKLPALVTAERRLSWPELRPLLEQLVDELAAACREGTLPGSLTVEQLWVQPSGRLVLLDSFADRSPMCPDGSPAAADEHRALVLLHETATLALEGRLPPLGESPRVPRAAIPIHAAHLLDCLAGGPRRYERVEQLQEELWASRSYPTQASRGLRAGQVALLGGLLFATMVLLSLLGQLLSSVSETTRRIVEPPNSLQYRPPALCLLAVGWAFLFRGGWALRWSGLVLVRREGRPASRLRCAWRAFWTWLPVAALCATGLLPNGPEQLLLAAVYVGLALLFPRRGPQDVLAGTCLVPR